MHLMRPIKLVCQGVMLLNLQVAQAEFSACSATTAFDIDFGTIVSERTIKQKAITQINIICDVSVVAYKVILSTGNSSSYRLRYMQNSGDKLFYNLYTDSTYQFILGDGTNGTYVLQGKGPCLPSDICRHKVYALIDKHYKFTTHLFQDNVQIVVIPEMAATPVQN